MTQALMSFRQKRCVPCEGGVKPLKPAVAKQFLKEIPGWKIHWGKKLTKRFEFKNFLEAMKFLNRVANVAEEEGHHPDFSVHYNKVDFVIWTHAIGGLSDNDFIVASKIDALIS